MKNKVKVLIIVIVLLLVALGIYLVLNKEDKYQNVRIISEAYSSAPVNKIIYNDKAYEVEYGDDIYSIKYYSGKIYYYKSEVLYDYFQEKLEVKDLESAFYELGELQLNEDTLTYSMNPIRKISYTEYKNGDKENIEYCVENIEGKYGLEIDRSYEIGEYGDVTIEGIVKEDGKHSKMYTKKDEHNNVIWSYETKGEIPAQCDSIGSIEITEDRIYLYEFGKIIVLNKEDGKIIWEQEDNAVARFICWYLDEANNLYIIGDTGVLYVIDKDGNINAKIENKALHEEMVGEGFNFNFINDNELLLEGIQRCIFIDLKKYSIKEILDVEFSEEDLITIKKIDEKDNVIWEYKTDGYIINAGDIMQDKLFIHESGKIVALNVETGKILWTNSDYKGENDPKYCLDSKGNMYLCSYNSPNLLIIDNKGIKVLKLESFDVSFDEYEGVKTIELRNNDKELVIKCDTFNIDYNGFILEKSAIVVNLKNYSITYENIEE